MDDDEDDGCDVAWWCSEWCCVVMLCCDVVFWCAVMLCWCVVMLCCDGVWDVMCHGVSGGELVGWNEWF